MNVSACSLDFLSFTISFSLPHYHTLSLVNTPSLLFHNLYVLTTSLWSSW